MVAHLAVYSRLIYSRSCQYRRRPADPKPRKVATVDLPDGQGQGIAWDRSSKKPTFWAISRPNKQVRTFTIPTGSIADPTAKGWQVLRAGHFQQ